MRSHLTKRLGHTNRYALVSFECLNLFFAAQIMTRYVCGSTVQMLCETEKTVTPTETMQLEWNRCYIRYGWMEIKLRTRWAKWEWANPVNDKTIAVNPFAAAAAAPSITSYYLRFNLNQTFWRESPHRMRDREREREIHTTNRKIFFCEMCWRVMCSVYLNETWFQPFIQSWRVLCYTNWCSSWNLNREEFRWWVKNVRNAIIIIIIIIIIFNSNCSQFYSVSLQSFRAKKFRMKQTI